MSLGAHIREWASTTEATLKEELGRDPAQTFRQTWDTRHRNLLYKESLQQKLRSVRKHIQTLLAAHQKSCKPNLPSLTFGPSFTPTSKTPPEDTSKPKTTTAPFKPPP